MKRAMRCHDFGSGREASRRQYREYWQGERQSHGPKFVPAPVLTSDIQSLAPGLRPKSSLTLSAGLAVFRILSCAVLRVIDDFGAQRTRVSLC
jgi:hypothetical protein